MQLYTFFHFFPFFLDELAGVTNVTSNISDMVTIEWERPFTLNVSNPDGPIMWFEVVIDHINITNITENFIRIGIGNFSTNSNYTCNITSLNKVGRGNSTTDTLYIPPSTLPTLLMTMKPKPMTMEPKPIGGIIGGGLLQN